MIDFDDSPYWWNVVEYGIDLAGTQLVADDPTFLVGSGEQGVVLTGDDILVLLADGEAVFRPSRSFTNAAPLGTQSAALTALTLSTTPTDNSSTQLDPGAGTHDVDLLRSTLAPGQTLTLHADIPAFVVVTAGSVTGADGMTTEAGRSQTLAGDFTLTNNGTDPAVVLVALIGPVVVLPQPSTTTTTSTTSTTAPPTTTTTTTTTTPPTTEPETTTTESTTTTTTTPPTTEPPGSQPPPPSSGP